MAEVIMPKMGDGMLEGKVLTWYKHAGDEVKKGEPLLQIETDKVNVDVEAEESGTLGELLVPEGGVAPVGATLAMIGDGSAAAAPAAPAAEGGAATAPAAPEGAEGAKPAAAPAKPAAGAAKPAAPAPAQAAPATPAVPENGRRRASPLARSMAKQAGVDIQALAGSGPGGRVVARDVESAMSGSPAPAGAARPAAAGAAAPGAAAPFLDQPLSAMRKTIAKRLVESLGPVPHFFLTVEADMEEAEEIRQRLNRIEGVKISVNDFVVRACALALTEHADVNASFMGESIRRYSGVAVALAVATEGGLVTPVIRDTDTKGLHEIATEARALAERARNRKLTPDQYSGSTFTVSNLGMFGIEEFTAIINPPNAAILAVGAASPRPAVVDGQLVVRNRMRMTLSCDHRVVDGATGAKFLAAVRELLEQPLRLLL